MSRWRAAGTHLGISLVVAGIVAAIIYFIWYPPPYFRIAGGSALMLLIMSVDVDLGPCLTLAVFRAGKKGMKLDLTIIALLQLSAFCYGIAVIAMARPVFVVGVVDRLVTVAANEIADEDLAQSTDTRFNTRSWSGPRLIGAIAPKDQTFALAQSAAAGRDIEKMPKYYVAFEQVAENLVAHAKPLAQLQQKFPQSSEQIGRVAADSGEKIDDLVYVPLIGHVESVTMVLSIKAKRPVGTISIDPW